jgi:hypothetical protein
MQCYAIGYVLDGIYGGNDSVNQASLATTMTFGNLLKWLRKRAGRTLEDFADQDRRAPG